MARQFYTGNRAGITPINRKKLLSIYWCLFFINFLQIYNYFMKLTKNYFLYIIYRLYGEEKIHINYDKF